MSIKYIKQGGRMKKIIISIVIVLSLVISYIPVPAYAYESSKTNMVEPSEYENHLPDYSEKYGQAPISDEPQVVLNNDVKATSPQELAYIAVFIEFPDQIDVSLDEPKALAAADMVMNTGGIQEVAGGINMKLTSLNEYFKTYSYGKLNLTTSFFPKDTSNQVKSHMASNPRGYYMKYSSSNPIGYRNGSEARIREKELIDGAMAGIKDSIERELSAENIDSGNDNYIDSINFFVESPSGAPGVEWGDLLWSHKSNGSSNTKIHGKSLNAYNLISTPNPKSPGGPFSYRELNGSVKVNRASYAVIQHEYMHTLGLPDLYRGDKSGDPVGFYDIMASTNGHNPQSTLGIMSREWLNWGKST